MGDIAPQRAVFLDDVEQNVQSARNVGIQGIVVDEDPSEAIAALRQLLLLDNGLST
jgi:FMN phosphatase YigB (HAD superfamily)